MWQCVHVIFESSSGQHGCWLHSHETESNNEFSATTCHAWCAKKINNRDGRCLVGWESTPQWFRGRSVWVACSPATETNSGMFRGGNNVSGDSYKGKEMRTRITQTMCIWNIIQYILGGFTMFSWKWQKKHIHPKSLMVPSSYWGIHQNTRAKLWPSMKPTTSR